MGGRAGVPSAFMIAAPESFQPWVVSPASDRPASET
jgi:hypothetical protein